MEAVFFYPLAIAFRKFAAVNAFILIEMLFFIAVLLVGDSFTSTRRARWNGINRRSLCLKMDRQPDDALG